MEYLREMSAYQWAGVVLFLMGISAAIGYWIREKQIESDKKKAEWSAWMDKQNGFIDPSSQHDQ